MQEQECLRSCFSTCYQNMRHKGNRFTKKR